MVILAVDTPASNVGGSTNHAGNETPRQKLHRHSANVQSTVGTSLPRQDLRTMPTSCPTHFSHTDPTKDTEQSANLARSTKPANNVEVAQATCTTSCADASRSTTCRRYSSRSVYCTSPLTPLRLYAARLLAPFFLELRRTPLWAFLALPVLVETNIFLAI